MAAPYAWRRRLTRGKSAELTTSPFLSRFFRLRDFLVRMWLWLAWKRLSSPDPVFLKRFAAARFVFIFGIRYSRIGFRERVGRSDSRTVGQLHRSRRSVHSASDPLV